MIKNNYLVYKVKDSDLYAAVGQFYQRDIRQYAAEYQCLSAVPSDRTVRAILFSTINEHLCELKLGGEEVPVPVNRLEFDAGNFRISA